MPIESIQESPNVKEENNQNLNSSSQSSDNVEENIPTKAILILYLTQQQLLVPLQMTAYQQLHLQVCTFQPFHLANILAEKFKNEISP